MGICATAIVDPLTHNDPVAADSPPDRRPGPVVCQPGILDDDSDKEFAAM
jgi:hypothetical protein